MVTVLKPKNHKTIFGAQKPYDPFLSYRISYLYQRNNLTYNLTENPMMTVTRPKNPVLIPYIVIRIKALIKPLLTEYDIELGKVIPKF
jgi:hypothetical protein